MLLPLSLPFLGRKKKRTHPLELNSLLFSTEGKNQRGANGGRATDEKTGKKEESVYRRKGARDGDQEERENWFLKPRFIIFLRSFELLVCVLVSLSRD